MSETDSNLKFVFPGQRRFGRIAAVALALAVLQGCDTISDWFHNPPPPLPGERISVMVTERSIEADPQLKDREILLPPPSPNPDWPQAGGYANHAMHHIEVGNSLKKAWSVDIGDGSGDEVRLIASPVIGDGRVFAVDADTEVSAYDVKNGRRHWYNDITPKNEDDEHMPGGLAYADGRVYVATGFAQVVALDAKTGKVIWRRYVGGPMRAAPTVRGGRVFVITLDNKLHTLSAKSGKVLWTFTGVSEVTSLLGSASPAVDSGIVIAPFSSGELVALRVENGRVLWSDSLAALRRSTTGISTLSHIRGRPIIDRGRVIAVSHGGVVTALELRSGRRIWDRRIGSYDNPWVAGDYVYMISTDSELICLSRNNGRVHWVQPLSRHIDNDIRKPAIIWTGPLLAGDRLIVAGSHGNALAVSPYTGKIVGAEKMPDGVTVSPVIAGQTVFFLTDDADLIAFR